MKKMSVHRELAVHRSNKRSGIEEERRRGEEKRGREEKKEKKWEIERTANIQGRQKRRKTYTNQSINSEQKKIPC